MGGWLVGVLDVLGTPGVELRVTIYKIHSPNLTINIQLGSIIITSCLLVKQEQTDEIVCGKLSLVKLHKSRLDKLAMHTL